MIPDLAAKAIAKALGEKFGGALMGALAAETVALGIFAREAATLAENLSVGIASETDVRSAVVALEAVLLGGGLVLIEGGVIGGLGAIAGIPASITITTLVVGVAAGTVFYEKKGSAIHDAIEIIWDGIASGKQPWNIFPPALDAYNKESKRISDQAQESYRNARNVAARRDPLVFDLDGDGLELSAASGNTLFDHNADGIKTGTGWARPDDGFLVRDINGNGTIDTGRELFGVDTIKSNGLLATDGFDALRDLDSNGDGVITSADAAYGELRIWQDSNQDGISQASELRTLADVGITSIGVNGTHTGPQAGQVINNNSVALSTTFTVNGQTRTVGAIDLEANNFFTEFPPQVIDDSGNPIPISAQAQALPQMNGSGMVRDMRAAASLDAGFAAAV